MNGDGKLTNGDIPENLWRDMRLKYVKTDVSYRDLSDSFNVSFNTLARRAKAEDWKVERAQYRATNLRKQRAALMRHRLEDSERDAMIRTRYAKAAREIMLAAMERLHSLRQNASVNSGVLIQIAATVRRSQEIEFVARGMATDVSKIQHEEYGSWHEYIESVRKERGLPDRRNPFAPPEQ